MNLKHQFWMFLGRKRILFFLFKFIEKINKGIVKVKRDSDIVIEGYPRTANTFAYAAFYLMQKRKKKSVSIAHHLHSPLQLIKGIQLGVPVILLIREPEEAITSLLIREKGLKINNAFKNYIKFHRMLLDRRDELVISDFQTTIKNFDKVIIRVNEKFGRSFNITEIDDYFLKECRNKVKKMDRVDTGSDSRKNSTVGLPNQNREELKSNIKKIIHSEVEKSLKEEADKLYYAFKAQAIVIK